MSETREPQAQTMETPPQPKAVPAGGGRSRSPLARFFGVVVRSQSWLNLLYLVLEFPLGLFYFVFLTTCLAVGISLLIIWVGIFVLGLTAACWWAFAAFERSLADGLLGTRLSPAPQPWRRATGTWPRIKAHFGSSATWKDLAFLFVKFPLGLLSFVVVVSLGATSLALVTAPIYYRYAESTDIHGIVHHGLNFGVWTVDRLNQALLLVPLGLLLIVVSFHAFNGLSRLSRAVARGLLTRDDSPRPARATAAAGPVGAGPAAPPPPSPIAPQPYGWVYYPPPPYPPPAYPPVTPQQQVAPQSPPPQQVAPQSPQTGVPGGAQPGAGQAGAAWTSGPWTQWPSLVGPSQPATPPRSAAPPPSAPPVAPAIEGQTAPAQNQHPAPPQTDANEQSPSQEEQS